MILTKAEKNKIYVANKEIKNNEEILTEGTPILFIKAVSVNEYIFEDYRAKKWILHEDDFEKEPINEIPSIKIRKLKRLKRFLLNNAFLITLLAAPIIFILTCIASIVVISSYGIDVTIIDIPTKIFLLLACLGGLSIMNPLILSGVECFITPTDNLCKKENIKELENLLNKTKILNSDQKKGDIYE